MSRWDTLIVMLEDIAHHTDRDDVREALEEARRGKLANDSAMDELQRCTGRVTHDEFTPCPVHDRRRT